LRTEEAHRIALVITDSEEAPFRYALAERCLPPAFERALLDWLETAACWRLIETDFYEQYEFSVLEQRLPRSVVPLANPDNLAAIREDMEKLFEVSLDERITLVAHKLVPGQRIAIHNDYLVGEETHRLTVQLNRGLRDEDGGFFMLFNGFDASDVHRILRPVSASGIAFAIGPYSHHAVSRLHGGERYTLVYSFYARTNETPTAV
jgi:hypothetical protein